MPNHCSNYLKVVGDPKEVMRFVETITVTKDGRESINILDTIVPCPQELRDTVSGSVVEDKKAAHEAQQKANIEKYGHRDWYDWCLANWGTKWGDYDTSQTFVSVNTDKDAMVIAYSYDTAWGPALNGISKVSEKFPTLWFINSYQESGMAFYGTAMFHDGRMYADDGGEFPDIPEDINWEDTDALNDAFDVVNEKVFDSIERLEISQMELYLPENLRVVAYAAP